MKKYFFFAAAALVALAACSKVETDPQTSPDIKIGYQVANYVTQTKAAGSFLDELNTDYGVTAENALFKSVAFINADDGNGGHVAPARFFNAATNEIETISYTAKTGEMPAALWEPSHTYYWPKSPNTSLDFFSWYDLSATASEAVANATYSSSTYTLAWANREIALKDNVMYADIAWDKHANTDGTYKYNDVKEGVPTLFHHALAQVRFAANVKTTYEQDSKDATKATFWFVTIEGLGLPTDKIHKKGDLSLTAASGATWTLPANLVWTASSTPAYLTAPFKADADLASEVLPLTDNDVSTITDLVFLTPTGNMPNNYFTVLPQQVTDDFLLNFKVKIVTKYGAYNDSAADKGASAATSVISTEIIKVSDFAKSGTALTASGVKLNAMNAITYWQMNKKYTYVFTIDPKTSTILYDPAVESWTEETATQEIPAV